MTGSLPLEHQLRFQRDSTAPSSPVYGRVIDRMIADVAAGGTCADLLGPRVDDPPGSALVLRFLAAVHRLVLAGEAPALAAHYPSAGGRPGRGLEDDFAATVAAHRDRIAAGLDEGVQTNEVGRSAALLGGYLELAAATGLALRVLEVGASAGLNLHFDRFGYASDGRVVGDASSPVRFDEPWAGAARPHLDAALSVAERRGCDPNPIDPTTEGGRLRLRSFVWPDQLDRLARLDAAVEVARRVPAAVDRSGAGDWLAAALAEPTPGLSTVVTHSIVMQYLDPDERRRVVDGLRAAGERATAAAPLAWLRMEAAGEWAEVRLTAWPGGIRRILATTAYHGPPVSWR